MYVTFRPPAGTTSQSLTLHIQHLDKPGRDDRIEGVEDQGACELSVANVVAIDLDGHGVLVSLPHLCFPPFGLPEWMENRGAPPRLRAISSPVVPSKVSATMAMRNS